MALAGSRFSGLISVFLASCVTVLLSVEKVRCQAIEGQAAHLLGAFDALSARSDLSDQELANTFLALAERSFDIDRIAAASLPRRLTLTPSAWGAYTDAFRIHLSIVYVTSVRRHGTTASRVVGIRRPTEKTAIVVLSTRTGNAIRRSTWILCSAATFLFCDVEVEGVRLSSRNRSDFSDVIDRDGFDAFVEGLRTGALVNL